jgi:hypothetical protein
MRYFLQRKNTAAQVLLAAGILIAGLYLSDAADAAEIPITQDNIRQLQGEWEGSRSGTESNRSGTGPVTMNVASVHPFRAKLLFYQTAAQGGTATFGFRGELKDGSLVGDMLGKGRPSLKLSLHKKGDGRLELRGEYSSGAARSFSGEFRLEKAAAQ